MEILMHYPENDRLYLKNPENSELGRKIVLEGIVLVNQLGIENFTFRKLASQIQSNEASIYRYFENKHNLLVYLISIYWEILIMKILFVIENTADPEEKLDKLIQVITSIEEFSPKIKNINLHQLHEIVISESSKVYLTKQVESEDRQGYFSSYEKLADIIAQVFIEINPEYEFPKALACNLIETTYEQFYFSRYFSNLTELRENSMCSTKVRDFLKGVFFSVLKADEKLSH